MAKKSPKGEFRDLAKVGSVWERMGVYPDGKPLEYWSEPVKSTVTHHTSTKICFRYEKLDEEGKAQVRISNIFWDQKPAPKMSREGDYFYLLGHDGVSKVMRYKLISEAPK